VIRSDKFTWVKPAFAELYRVLKRDSFCVFFYGWAHIQKFTAAFAEAGFRPIGHMTFPKPYTSGARFLQYRHEFAYLLAKGEPKQPDHPIADVIAWTHYTGNKLPVMESERSKFAFVQARKTETVYHACGRAIVEACKHAIR
jgi:adenine-specific DNA-methyltransferase